MREQRLDGRGGVGVRRRIHDWQLHLHHVIAYLLSGMVRSVIHEEQRVLLPARRVLVQLHHQVPKE